LFTPQLRGGNYARVEHIQMTSFISVWSFSPYLMVVCMCPQSTLQDAIFLTRDVNTLVWGTRRYWQG